MRWGRLGAIALAAALAGCAPEYLPVDAAGHHTARAPQTPPAEFTAPPAAAATPSAAPAVADQVPADTCGAKGLAYLVGKPRSEIPIATDLSRRRVVCTTCTMTQDYRPDRLTILFDQQTGLVAQLRCG